MSLGFVRSSVGGKVLLAGSGCVLVGWLALHMLGNLGVFSGAAAFDGYAALLRRAWPLLWLARIALVAAAVVHVALAISLVRRARRARGATRARAASRSATLASRTMVASGALLLAFIAFHLLHMTFGSVHPAFVPGGVHHNLVTGLSAPALRLVYVAASALLGLHLFHGLYALPRSLGLVAHAGGPRRRRPVALAIALALSLGFALVPLAISIGALR
jgi:succinate dehydrogenase / fumarate reductase cytochrome b subunit